MKKAKNNYSISIGKVFVFIVLTIVILSIIVICIKKKTNTINQKKSYESNNSMFSNSELKEVIKNESYKSNKKISKQDLKIGDIYCGMKLSEMLSVLGECDDIYNGKGENYKDVNYQCYRYNKQGIIIDLDKNTEKIKRIKYYGNEFSNKRGIKIGSSVQDVISNYHSEKNIGVYENNKGKYKVLYHSNDVFDYLYNEKSEKKSLGYIFEYLDRTYKIEYVENNLQLKFEFLNNNVNSIYMSEK